MIDLPTIVNDGSSANPESPLPRAPSFQPLTWEQVANWNRLLFDFAVEKAAAFGDLGQFDKVLQWCSLAAWFASRRGYFGKLSSRELEAELLRAARSLPTPIRRGGHGARRRWVHVMSEAYETLGHTNLCRRWIQYSTSVSHDVILLEQGGKIPENLVSAVREAQGQCIALDITNSQLKRAAALRAYAWEQADLVVLHTHPEDVIATTAFGVAGGPPVVQVNHADHSFWVGCSIADVVMDIRDSGHLWTKQVRGVGRAAVLPLPLQEQIAGEKENRAHQRAAARKILGIPMDATLLLTVGSAAKYQPLPGLNFVATAREIIDDCQNAYLIAVGPKDEGEWKAARKATGGRILAVGRQSETTIFCQAADIYLEGFPTGSLTALLEAGLAGLPCVRSPRECVPPYCSDGISLRSFPQPADLSDYVATVRSLIANPDIRVEQGSKLQELTHRHHCRTGWLENLHEIEKLVPEGHSIYADFEPAAVEYRVQDWFLSYLYVGRLPRNWSAIAVPFLIQAWKRTDTTTFLDQTFVDILRFQKFSGGPFRTPSKFVDKVWLWWLNREIRRSGLYERLFAGANKEFKVGNVRKARKLSYRCLSAKLSCIVKMEWLKLLIKVHGGEALRTRQGNWYQLRSHSNRRRSPLSL